MEQILCKLLGYRRGAAAEFAFVPILLQRLADLLPVETRVIEEARIFAGQDRAHQVSGDSVIRNPGLNPPGFFARGPCLRSSLIHHGGALGIHALDSEDSKDDPAVVQDRDSSRRGNTDQQPTPPARSGLTVNERPGALPYDLYHRTAL